jgi:hypothetical protein
MRDGDRTGPSLLGALSRRTALGVPGGAAAAAAAYPIARMIRSAPPGRSARHAPHAGVPRRRHEAVHRRVGPATRRARTADAGRPEQHRAPRPVIRDLHRIDGTDHTSALTVRHRAATFRSWTSGCWSREGLRLAFEGYRAHVGYAWRQKSSNGAISSPPRGASERFGLDTRFCLRSLVRMGCTRHIAAHVRAHHDPEEQGRLGRPLSAARRERLGRREPALADARTAQPRA